MRNWPLISYADTTSSCSAAQSFELFASQPSPSFNQSNRVDEFDVGSASCHEQNLLFWLAGFAETESLST